ncbi:ATP-binding protein [Cytophagaceae bacterium ABcell3]|nr:ATP-binding protein [Cytophagaceae bacterium ABcell3]
MLLRFVTNNFLSFGEETEFNMLAGSYKTHKHHVYNVGKVNLLKAAAIYGANGAGKSNLVKAIEFLQEAIKEGGIFKSINDKKFKLNKSNLKSNVSFEAEFVIDDTILSYGVSFNNNIVFQEWLYEARVTADDKMIFEREVSDSGKVIIRVAAKYKKTQKQKLLIELMEESLLKPSELLLGKSEELKIPEITTFKEAIEHSLIVIHPGSRFQGLVPKLNSSKRFKLFTNDLLKAFDTGVTELSVEGISLDKFFGDKDDDLKKEIINVLESGKDLLLNTQEGGVLAVKENGKYLIKKTIAQHTNTLGEVFNFDLSEESDGTQRLLDFIPAFDGILNTQATYVIDEIDQSLHPALLKALLTKIMSDERTKGQLIFTTHESNLLDLNIFRQDEIWFAEKDTNTGASQLYSLSDFKPRYDLDIKKGYLKGRFGAIPFLTPLEHLNWKSYEAEEERL